LAGDRLDLTVRTLNISAGGGQSERSYYGTIDNPGKLRKLIHKIANDSYKFITGEDGIFLTQIVAVRATPNGKHVVKMDWDGHDQQRLTTAPGGVFVLPIFKPEGDGIYVTSLNKKNQELLEITIASRKTRSISKRDGLNLGARVSPDGNSLALTLSMGGTPGIYLTDRNGKNEIRFTDEKDEVSTSPEFNPNGKEIAFVSNRSGNPNIFIKSIDGTGLRRVTFDHPYNQTPKFGPHGDVLVYVGRTVKNEFDLFMLDLKTETTSRITQNQGRNEDPSFSPKNGRLIVFTRTPYPGAKADLYISTLDGTMQRQITSEGGFQTPCWGPLVNNV
jgi:TolB protein